MKEKLQSSEYQDNNGTIPLSATQENQQLVMAAYQAETSLNDPLNSCREAIAVDLTTKPFWNERCAKIASNLWLPTETELLDSQLASLDTLSKSLVENSWFSAKMHSHKKQNSLNICAICAGLEITKSRLVKLSPNRQQRREFCYWLNVSRFVFNWTIDFIRTCCNWTPSWMEIKKYATQQLPEWTKRCPFQIKGIVIKEAHQAFFKGHPHFRSRKNPVQSCFIPSSAIKAEGIYPRVSGKGLRYSEPLPESLRDSRLIWKAGKFYIALPQRSPRVGENPACVVAVVRTFATFYASDTCGFLGQGDFSRLHQLAMKLDNLISRMTQAGRQEQRRMRLEAARMREKIKNLVVECVVSGSQYIILLPTFETRQMSLKSQRQIKSKTVRSLLSFAHSRFKQFLKHKAFEYGKRVMDVCEAYTSKTHPETGEVRNISAAKRIRLLSGEWVNRDRVGARNIWLRALVDSPDHFMVAVA